MKRYGFWHIFWKTRTRTVGRVLMNIELSKYTLRGTVIDVGGGHRPDYFEYLQQAPGVKLNILDGSMSGIDFEKDALPFKDASVDTIIFCNILEHVYNYRFLVAETARVLAPGGQLLGCVPFWVGYHPDPRDFFRYTEDALERILKEKYAHVSVRRLGGSPIMANFETIMLSVPPFIRPPLFIWYSMLDRIFLKLRPNSARRNPLALFFTASHDVVGRVS